MGRFSADGRHIGAARRGQIVQRVLVDGWSAAQAAAAFGLADRQVARWVAAYRRRGMASLRDDGEPAVRRWLRRLCAPVARIVAGRIVAPPGPDPAQREVRFVRVTASAAFSGADTRPRGERITPS